MDEFAAQESDDVQTWSARIKRAARSQEARALAVLIKSGAPIAAVAGRPDLIAGWLRQLPRELVQNDPHLLYWSGTSMALTQPAEAHPHLCRAFELLRDEREDHWGLLAWAGLVDVIFLLYRDLHELDPLLAWMTLEREAQVDRMPRPLRSLVVGSALFALPFRQPLSPRVPAWRDRAERLVEHSPTSNLGARLTAGLMLTYTWSGNLPAAEIVWKRFEARAANAKLSPLGSVIRHVNEATLRLHQGRLDECIAAVDAGLALSALHGLRVWDGVMHCHGAAAYLSRGMLDGARRHLLGVERLFADGIAADEAYYRAMLFWCDFVCGERIGVVARCESALELTDTKGVPYFMAVCRLSAALTLYEAGHRDKGRALLDAGIAMARELQNPLLLWIGGLFEAHVKHTDGDAAGGDRALQAAMKLGRDHALAHFFCWPREIVRRLVDRALERNFSPDYLKHLIDTHAIAPGDAPARSDQWAFAVRIYTFGEPRVVHADGRVEPLSVQFQRQIELLAALVAKQGKPTPLHVIAADLYAGEDVDPIASVKRVLHSLRSRVGHVVEQRHASLALDFEKVWIDACSFQQLQREAADAEALEAWLDRHYQGHFMDSVASSDVVRLLRRRFADSAQRTIRDALTRSRREKADATEQRLEARWQPLFPGVFDSPGR